MRWLVANLAGAAPEGPQPPLRAISSATIDNRIRIRDRNHNPALRCQQTAGDRRIFPLATQLRYVDPPPRPGVVARAYAALAATRLSRSSSRSGASITTTPPSISL